MSLHGTLPLTRLALRLDRVRLPVWIVAMTVVVVATAAGFAEIYPDAASRQQFATGIGANPALSAIYGRMEAPESIGGLTVWRQGAFQFALIALLGLLTVIRHTRAAEQEGRTELLGSAAVGTRAPLAAALLIAALAASGVGLSVAAGLIAAGEDAAGSLAFGGALAATGLVFAGVAAVTAQLADDAGTARFIAGGLLGVAFALRAAGDAASGGFLDWLAWASPLAWAHKVRPYADEQWWVLVLPVLLALVLVTAATALLTRRDIGSGVFATQPGPPRAKRYLGSATGLAWRLQRGGLLAWLLIMLVVGALFGGIADAITQLFEDSPQLKEILQRLGGAGQIIDAFFGAIMSVFALVVSAYSISSTLQIRAEETSEHAELLLAGALTRLQWVGSHLLFASAAPVLLLAAAGAATGLASGLVLGNGVGDVPRLAAAALVQLPAVWVMVGIAVLIIGVVPRWSALAYGALGLFLVLGQVGEVLRLDQNLLNISPFVHVPALPHASFSWPPLVALTSVALTLAAGGMLGLRRRDLGA